MKDVVTLAVRTPSEYEMALEVRREVFIEEQGLPASLEIDEHEKEAVHFLSLADGVPVGAGRLRLKKSYVKFERIATLKSCRGQGIGRLLMACMQ